MKLRMELTKGEEIRFISHLDYAKAIERSIRRAKIPAAYSEGFNPHMKISFASALAVGVTSEAEYMDLELTEVRNAENIGVLLNRHLPAGIMVKRIKALNDRIQALMTVVNEAEYAITLPAKEGDLDTVEQALRAFNGAPQVMFTRESPKGRKMIDLKQFMAEDIKALSKDETIYLKLAVRITPAGSIKPVEVLAVLADNFDLPIQAQQALIHRTGLFAVRDNKRFTLMDLFA